MPGISHRLRGHHIDRVYRHVDTSRGGIESGRLDDLMVCSCGKRWLHLPEPLTNRTRWLAA